MESENRRKRTRVQFSVTVEITADEKYIVSGKSRDISLKGIYVITDEKLPVNTHCELGINLTGSSSQLALRMKGKVTREGTDGFGIEFLEMESDSFYHLRQIVLYNSPDPSVVEAECEENPGFR